MPEVGCQIRVSERAWKISDIRERSFQVLRRKLELAGAHDIKIEEPKRIFVDGYYDEDGEWVAVKPYWAWDIAAIGEA